MAIEMSLNQGRLVQMVDVEMNKAPGEMHLWQIVSSNNYYKKA
jgi:hypothetical protein